MEAFALALWLNQSTVPEAINPLPAILMAKPGSSSVQESIWSLETPSNDQISTIPLTKRGFIDYSSAGLESATSHETAYLSAPRLGDKLKIKTMIAGDWAAVSGQVKIRDLDIV